MNFEPKTEADVIELVGYETPMEFVFTEGGTPMFRTCFPVQDHNRINDKGIFPQYYYEVEFYEDENEKPSFFRIDSFSNFLSSMQIARVVVEDDVTKERAEIYFRKYNETSKI